MAVESRLNMKDSSPPHISRDISKIVAKVGKYAVIIKLRRIIIQRLGSDDSRFFRSPFVDRLEQLFPAAEDFMEGSVGYSGLCAQPFDADSFKAWEGEKCKRGYHQPLAPVG